MTFKPKWLRSFKEALDLNVIRYVIFIFMKMSVKRKWFTAV